MADQEGKWELLDDIVPEGLDVFSVWARANTDAKPTLWYRCVAIKIHMRESQDTHRFDKDLECTRYPSVRLVATAGEEGTMVLREHALGGWELPEYPVIHQSEDELGKMVDRMYKGAVSAFAHGRGRAQDRLFDGAEQVAALR